MLVDTHCHLNFATFDGRVKKVINDAKTAGVDEIIVPGTDIESSKKAVEIAEKFVGVYAAVGIHPHHIFEAYSKSLTPKFFDGKQQTAKNLVSSLLKFLSHPKVVAIGEVGIDRHIYQKTKYPNYKIEKEFVELQKIFLIEQIKLAHKYNKALIFHNREAKKDFLEILINHQSLINEYSSVFHCCEPDSELLEFAKKNKMFIGVDGDIFYKKEKQVFIKTVPVEMLVLETDSPFLSPDKKSKNEPKNIKIIAEFVAELKEIPVDLLAKQTTENARRLFKIK